MDAEQDDVIGRLLVKFAIELAVDDADDADGVLCVDCITLLDELLLVAV